MIILAVGELLSRLGEQTFLVVLLVGGIYVVSKLLLAAQASRVSDLKERLDEHSKRCDGFERLLHECYEDRTQLWKYIAGTNRPTPPKTETTP